MASTTVRQGERGPRRNGERHADDTRRRNVRLAVIIAVVAVLFYVGLWLKAVL